MKPWERYKAPEPEIVRAKGKPWETYKTTKADPTQERANVRRGLNPDGTRLLPGAGSERTESRITADSRQATTTDLSPEERIKRAEETRLREVEESKERGLGAYTSDRLQSMGSGALNAVSGLVDAANTDYGTGLPPVLESSIAVGSSILGRLGVDKAREVADSMAANAKPKSEFARSFADTASEYAQGADANLTWRERAAKRKLAEAEGVAGKLAYLSQNPGQVAELAADSIPYMAAGGGVGAAVGRVIPGAAVATNLGTQGIMSASSSAQEARGMIDQLPDEELAQLSEYRDLLANYDAATARKILSQRANDEAFASGLVTNAVTLGLTAKLPTLEKVLHGAAGGSTSRAVNALRTGATETAQEGLQGAGERLATNIGASASDSRVGLTDKLGEAALLEGIVGGPMGAAGGFIQTPAQKQQAIAEDLKAQRAVAETPTEVGTLDAGIALAEARADQAAKAPWRINKAAREAARNQDVPDIGRIESEETGLEATAAADERTVPGAVPGTNPADEPGTAGYRVAAGAPIQNQGGGPSAVQTQDTIDEAELSRLLDEAGFGDDVEQSVSQDDADGRDEPILASRRIDEPPQDDGLESEELDPNDPVIARMLADQEAGMAARELERTEGPSDALTEGFRALAKNPELFRSGMLKDGTTLSELAPKAGLNYGATKFDEEVQMPYHAIIVDQGAAGKREAKVFTTPDAVWIDVAGLKEGGGGGDSVYNIAQSLAVNTGKEFIQDPQGLSDTAMYRRPMNQTSGILKADSAVNFPVGEFLASQRKGGPKTRPIKQDPRGRVNPSLREHLLTDYHNATLAVPEVKGIRYDADTEQFVDRTGSPVTDDDFQRLADYRLANPIESAMVRKRSEDGGTKYKAPVGSNTLKVAALVETLMGATDPGTRAVLVGKLRSIASRGVGTGALGQLTNILPSRRVEDGSVRNDAGRYQRSRPETGQPGDGRVIPGVRANVDGGNGSARASKPGVTESAIRDHLTQAFGRRAKRLLDSGKSKIVQSESDVPASIRARSKPLSDADGTIQGFYDPKSGESYIIADNVRDLDSARAVFLHEEGVHAGMKSILGDKFGEIATRLRDLEQTGSESDKRIISEARRRVEAAETPAQFVDEELIAHTVELAEKNAKPSGAFKRWLTNVLNSIREWALGKGIRNLTIEDLRMIARGAIEQGNRIESKRAPKMESRATKDTITVDGKERPRLNSNGKPIAETDEAIKAFYTWFGDSKAVDEAGNPQVLYHGTDKKFTKVDLKKSTSDIFWMTTNKNEIETGDVGAQGSGVIMELYAKIENPAGWKQYDDLSLGQFDREGLDGAILPEDDGYTAFVLNPNQVKSATRNKGTFSPSDDSILASRVVDETPIEDMLDSSDELKRARKSDAYLEGAENRIYEAKGAARDKRQEAASSLGVNGPSLTWELDSSRFAEGVKGAFNRLRLEIQDKYGAIAGAQKDIEKVIGKMLSDSMNVWRRENLMHGRVSAQIKDLHDDHVKPIKSAMKELGITPDVVEDYLEARAAPARNKRVAHINPKMPDGGSGMLTAEAQAFLDGTAVGHRSKTALTPELRRKAQKIARLIDSARDQTRQRLLDSGQITQEQYNQIASSSTYAPLRDGAGNDIGVPESRGGGIDIRGKPIKEALGRGKGNRAENIIANVFGDAERSIVQGEKTRVGQTLVRLILGSPNKDVWEVEPVVIERKFSESQDLVYEALKAIDNDPNAVRVMIKGKPYRLVLKDDRMAKAIKNLGAEQLPGVFKMLGAINRYFSAVLTRYNPAFVPINMIRDLGLGVIGIASEHGAKAGAQAALNYLPAMRSLWREARGKPPLGQTAVYTKEYKDNGGRTGFQKYENVEEIAQALNDEFKGFVQLMKEKKPYYLVKRVLRDSRTVKLIEDANDTIENTMRLAAFIARRKAGASAEQAAEYAKNITVNFNRRGHQTGWLNSSFLFFNAATQGSTRTFQLLKQPKVMATMGAMASLQFVFAMIAMGAEDEDEDGVKSAEKISEGDWLRNFIIPIVGEKDGRMTVKMVKIPVPYGFNFFSYMGGRLARASFSKDETDVTKLTNDLGVAAIDAVSPLKFTDGIQGVKPYLMKIFDSIGYNENDFGSDITSEQPYARYDIPRASLGRASTPEPYHIAAKALNALGGGDEVTKPRILESWTDRSPEDLRFLTEAFGGGLLRTGTQAYSAGQKAFAGVDLSFNDLPIIKSLFSEVDMERATQDRYYKVRARIAQNIDSVKIAFRKGGVDAARKLLVETPELKGYRLHRFETGKYTNKAGDIQLEAVNESNGEASLAKRFKEAEKELGKIADRINIARSDRDKPMADRMREIETLEKEREAAQRKLTVKWRNRNG